MGVQVRTNNDTRILLRSGGSIYKNGTIAQDAARTTVLKFGTVMAYNVVNLNWVPWISVVATQGEAIPRGIYVGEEITAADLVAGDIENSAIVTGGSILEVDDDLIVYDDGTLTAATVVGVSNGEMLLREIGIFLVGTTDNTELEN